MSVIKLSVESSIVGCLVGGAVGDALGAPFEGLWGESIPSANELLSEYHEYHGYPRGQYTDDTQLTKASIDSIVGCGDLVVSDIAAKISELWRHQSVIGPGGACTQAAERFLAGVDFQSMGAPEGQAGNGTAMRTAAIGLWFAPIGIDGDADDLVAAISEVSRVTHHDRRSVAGGVVVAAAANLMCHESNIEAASFCGRLAEVCEPISGEMAKLLRQLPDKMETKDALSFVAFAGQANPEFERPIISPFVIPTVLASVYSVLTNLGSWPAAVTEAIRLGGDVDTLGAIVGALSGARHGRDAIPDKLVDDLQDSKAIQSLALKYANLVEQPK